MQSAVGQQRDYLALSQITRMTNLSRRAVGYSRICSVALAVLHVSDNWCARDFQLCVSHASELTIWQELPSLTAFKVPGERGLEHQSLSLPGHSSNKIDHPDEWGTSHIVQRLGHYDSSETKTPFHFVARENPRHYIASRTRNGRRYEAQLEKFREGALE
jgi:hypothetical protein